MSKLPDGRIGVVANLGVDEYEFDYLVWSGTPSDFGLVQKNVITDEKEASLFSETEAFFMASSIVNVRGDTREAPTVAYRESEIWDPDCGVYVDNDATAYALVSNRPRITGLNIWPTN